MFHLLWMRVLGACRISFISVLAGELQDLQKQAIDYVSCAPRAACDIIDKQGKNKKRGAFGEKKQ